MSRDTPLHPASAECQKCETSRELAKNRQGTSTVCPKLPHPKILLERFLPGHLNQTVPMQSQIRQILGCVTHPLDPPRPAAAAHHLRHHVPLNERRRTSRRENVS